MQMKKNTVITGIGIVSPIGIGRDAFWENLFLGKCGIKQITLFDTKDLNVKSGGEISDFTPHKILNEKTLMDLDRATLLLLCAAKYCLEDADFSVNEDNSTRTAVSVGTTFGSIFSISRFNRESFTEGPRYVNPSIFPSTVGNSAASRIAIKFKIKGFNSTISTGMCAALDALDYARDAIELDRAEQVLVGCVEDLSIQAFLGFYKLKYLSGVKNNTPLLSCPFDKRRDGIVFSEGATVFLLQTNGSASNAHVYGKILGIGSCFDPAKFYRYSPKGEGMKEAMRLALKDAGLEPKDIDCVFANANSTKDADAIESRAIREVFGKKAEDVLVTAIKSMVGETVSNSGGIALAAALAAIDKQMIPPTINYLQKDTNCDLNYVINNPKKNKVSRVLVNCFGPNGTNTSVIVGK